MLLPAQMPEKTRWLIDFDSVLSDTFGHQIEYLNQRFGTTFTRDDFKDWHTEKVLTPEQADFMWGSECFLSHRFQMECKPIKGGKRFLQSITKRGLDEVFIVSDRPESLRHVTEFWVYQHLGPYEVILTRSTLSKSEQDLWIPTKQDVAWTYGLTKVVEDAPHHVEAFGVDPHIEQVYLMDTPSNQHIPESERVLRVRSWNEILKHDRALGRVVTV